MRRTVESAQGVLAGFYGKDQLTEYGNDIIHFFLLLSAKSYVVLLRTSLSSHGDFLKLFSCYSVTFFVKAFLQPIYWFPFLVG